MKFTRRLRSVYGPQPSHLFISGRRAPQIPDPHPDIHDLPEAEFLAEIEDRYGRLPDIITQDQEILQLFLSILRADVKMLEAHPYTFEPPLTCPIYAFGGLQDESVEENDLIAWREQTTASFQWKMFPGNHFFIQNTKADLVQVLTQELTQSLKS